MYKQVHFCIHLSAIYLLFEQSSGHLIIINGSTYGPNPRYRPNEILRLRDTNTREYPAFEGIPESQKAGLKYIEISWRTLTSGSDLIKALEGCVNLEELRLEGLVQRTNNTRNNNNGPPLDFGSERAYLPALQKYTFTTTYYQPLTEPSHLEALLPFYKKKKNWNVSQLYTLGVHVQIYKSFYESFEFNYQEQEINAANIPFLDSIVADDFNTNSNFALRSLIYNSRFADSTPAMAIKPSFVPATLHKLSIHSDHILLPNVSKQISLRAPSLQYLYLGLHNLFNPWDRIDVDIALLPRDSIQELMLTNVNLQQSSPNQFKRLVTVHLTNCLYNESFIEWFDSTFYYVNEVNIWNDPEIEKPLRDQQLLTKLFNTQVKSIRYYLFRFGVMNAYFNYKLSNHQFIQELEKIGEVRTDYDGLQVERKKYKKWPLVIPSSSSATSNLGTCTRDIIMLQIIPSLHLAFIYSLALNLYL